MTAEERPPGNRLDEVADAAVRAFRMLPAMPQDAPPRDGASSRRPPAGSPRTRTQWNAT